MTVSFPSPPPAGDILLVAFWNNGQSSGASNTYTAPSGWNLVDQNLAHGYLTYQVYSHVVAAGETNAYAFTPQAAQREQAWVAADVSGASSVDGVGNAFIGNSASFTSASVTPSASGDLAIAFNLPTTLSSVSWTNAAGWSAGTGPTDPWSGETVYQQIPAITATSESATLSSASTGFSGLVMLASSGATPMPTASPTPAVTPTPTIAPTATPPPGGGGNGSAPSPMQWNSGSAYAPASLMVSFQSPPAPGDLLLAVFWNNGQSSAAANTYTPPAGWSTVDQNTSHAYLTYQMFSHVVGSSEANQYVFTPQAAQREQVWIAADVGKASGVDRAANTFVGDSSAFVTPNETAPEANELAIAFNLPTTLSSVTWTNGTGWSQGAAPTSTWSGEAVYETVPPGVPVSQTATLSAASTGFSAVVFLTPVAAVQTPTPSPVDWSTFGYDLQRTGYNPQEKTIGTGSFGTMHSFWSSLPNTGYFMQSEPVVAMNVNVGGTTRNLLYDGGQAGMFYALDADTGTVVWSKQLASGSFSCASGKTTQFGVEGTPAVDRSRNLIYVPDGSNQVHALDLASGAEAAGWPISVAPVTGHDFIHAALTYNAANGLLYVETSSTCDITPWYGRISAINVSSAALVQTFYPSQGASGGGIWGFGGASIDPATNNVFIAIGNSDGASQTAYYGEQIVELSADLSTVIAHDYPPGMPVMADADFGATPLLFQPLGCPPLLAAMNKAGAFVLYSRDNISAGPTQIINMAPANSTASFRGIPAYDPVTNYVYVELPSTFGTYQAGVGAFSMAGDCTVNPAPAWNAAFGPDGASVQGQTTRSPITIANGVLYVSGYTDNTTYAFNAATGARLWSSPLDNIGIVGPVVSSGRLYVGDYGGTIHAWKP